MKRFRKMVDLGFVAEQMIKEQGDGRLADVLQDMLPSHYFGSAIGRHIESMRVEQGRLILSVPDQMWRRELKKQRSTLLDRARKIDSGIQSITVSN